MYEILLICYQTIYHCFTEYLYLYVHNKYGLQFFFLVISLVIVSKSQKVYHVSIEFCYLAFPISASGKFQKSFKADMVKVFTPLPSPCCNGGSKVRCVPWLKQPTRSLSPCVDQWRIRKGTLFLIPWQERNILISSQTIDRSGYYYRITNSAKHLNLK